VFGSQGGKVIALDRKTGAEIWRRDTRADLSSSPVVLAGKVVVGTRSGLLAGLEPLTGEVAWRLVFWGSSVESTPAPGEGSRFYIGSSDLRRVSLIDAADGHVLWRTDVFGVPWARPAIAGKRVFAAAVGVSPYEIRHLGSLSALDAASGRILWRWPIPDGPALYTGFIASPAVAEGLVIIGDLDGTLYAFPAGD
jgi:outer membrane protein assembly factor BamB